MSASPIDLAAVRDVKDRTDLVALIGRDTQLKKVAATRGGEWAGPCPFCGGRDRLRVQPEARLWWCRHCQGEQWQDAIAYIQQRDKLGFREALEALGGGLADVPRLARPVQPSEPVAVESEPSQLWREKGEALVEWCQAQLWVDTPDAARWRDWLHGRGLKDETLRAWRVGLNPQDWRPAPETWGHPAGMRFWIPAGVVLPWYAAGVLWQLKIRRPDELVATGAAKYGNVAGGHPVLFGADRMAGKRVAVLAEGEFDALLLWQAAGGLVDVVTLGGCDKRLGARALVRMLPYQRILVAFDADEPDRRGVRAGDQAAGRLAALSSRMRRLAVPAGKDITAFAQGGGRLQDWIRFALAREDGPSIVSSGPILYRPEETIAESVVDALGSAVLARAEELDWPQVRTITGQYLGPGETDWQRVVHSPRLEEPVRGMLLGGLKGALARRLVGVPEWVSWRDWHADNRSDGEQ